jgi:Ala-tRNA(Pro) deacylase
MAVKKKAKAKRGKAKKATKKTKRKTKKKRAGKPAKRGKKKSTTKKKSVKKKSPKKRRKVKKSARKATEWAVEPQEGVEVVIPVTPAPFIDRPQPSVAPITFRSSAASKVIKDFLTSKKVKFESLLHSPTFTAQKAAESVHISGKNVAKTVIIKIDGNLAMVIEPAHLKVDLDALKRQLNAQSVGLAPESQFRNRFPGCELGAMPPFGNLYNMPVYVSDNLSRDEFITFNAGTHSELIKMRYRDFYTLVHPIIVYA